MRDSEFSEILDSLREEVLNAIESFYSYVGIHNQLSSDRDLYAVLNQNPSFWNIVLQALQYNFFIALGRVFDDSPNSQSIHKLVNACLSHPKFFSREALGGRRMQNGQKPPWLDEFLSNAFEPKVSHLRVLKREVSNLRKAYDPVYKDIRNKVVAHTELRNHEDVSNLFSKTQIGEIERILYGLYDVLDSMWELFHNGRKLELGSKTYDHKDRISNVTRNALNTFKKNNQRLHQTA